MTTEAPKEWCHKSFSVLGLLRPLQRCSQTILDRATATESLPLTPSATFATELEAAPGQRLGKDEDLIHQGLAHKDRLHVIAYNHYNHLRNQPAKQSITLL
jgi:hypothetical protein